MGMFDPDHVCIACGHIGKPKKIYGFGLAAELFVWIICLILSASMSWMFIFLAIFTSIFRSSSAKNGCETCSSAQIIPTDSPKGRELTQK